LHLQIKLEGRFPQAFFSVRKNALPKASFREAKSFLSHSLLAKAGEKLFLSQGFLSLEKKA